MAGQGWVVRSRRAQITRDQRRLHPRAGQVAFSQESSFLSLSHTKGAERHEAQKSQAPYKS